jgi:hypothetical protein
MPKRVLDSMSKNDRFGTEQVEIYTVNDPNLFTSSVLESPLISTVTSVTVTTYDQSGGISRP